MFAAPELDKMPGKRQLTENREATPCRALEKTSRPFCKVTRLSAPAEMPFG
jgi:hypothetical protein